MTVRNSKDYLIRGRKNIGVWVRSVRRGKIKLSLCKATDINKRMFRLTDFINILFSEAKTAYRLYKMTKHSERGC